MTVSTEISSNEYTGNGVTTDFDYKFRIFKANQLSVIASDADGDNVVTLRLGTDYTVTGANKSTGGKVILTKPLANGHKISIARDIPITQETSFRNQGKFLAETHEDAFDYLTMIVQRIWGSLGSLYLKRPNILANWFDAKGYRIANLGKPKRDSDAVDLGTMKDAISSLSKRSLRVDDMDIAALPKASDRAGNVITFDKDGKPIVVAPASGSAVDVLNKLSDENLGDALIAVRQLFSGAITQTQHDKNAQSLTVLDWGAKEGIDSSLAAQNMIDDTGMLIVPSHFTLIAKNINLALAKKVYIYGVLMLPDNCSDFDRLLYGDNVAWLEMHINEIDGNKAGQSGQIGTHLIYLTNSPNITVYIKKAKNHYYPRTFTSAPSPDGVRDDGTGCLFFYKCHNSTIGVDRLDSWGHEGLQIRDTNRTTAYLGHAQGYDDGDEYSGIQFNGRFNSLLYASTDKTGASGIGFDSEDSHAGTLISTNNRYFHGINLGHQGSPANRTILDCVITYNTAQAGINFGGGTNGVRVKSYSIIQSGTYGAIQTDLANNNWLLNGSISKSTEEQVRVSNSKLYIVNSDISDLGGKGYFRLVDSGSVEHYGVIFNLEDSNMQHVVDISGLSEVTVKNGNIRQNSMPKIFPSTKNGAAALLYISSLSDGTMTVKTGTGQAAGGGSFFRYQVI